MPDRKGGERRGQLPGGGFFRQANDGSYKVISGVEMPVVRLVVFFQEAAADGGK